MDPGITLLLNLLSLALATFSLLVSILIYLRSIRLRNIILAKLVKPSGKRIRRRYVVIKLVSRDALRKEEVEEALSIVFTKVFGEVGYVKANPQLIYFDGNRGSCIVRVNHTHVKALLSVVWMIRSINNKQCLMIPVKTTGTIKKAYKVMMGSTG